MTSTENNVSSSKDTHYQHDKERGKWSTKWDFYIASIANSYGYKNLTAGGLPVMTAYGIVFIIPTLINIFLISMPVFFVRSAIGQFASTGVISIFRISPLFKGIGYSVIILTIVACTTASLTTAIEFLYIYSSIQIELPWASCNNTWNSDDCKEDFNATSYYAPTSDHFEPYSEYEYFSELTKSPHLYKFGENTFSLPVLGGIFVVWLWVAIVINRGIRGVESLIRYSTIIPFSILFLLFLRCLFLPGAWNGIAHFFKPDFSQIKFLNLFITAPYMTMYFYGCGWPSLSTLASYNDMKTNVSRYSVTIPMITFGLTVFSQIFVYTILGFLANKAGRDFITYHEESFFPFIVFAKFASEIEASHLWALLFFIMLILIEVNTIVIQALTVITGLFDEFPVLRKQRRYVALGICGILFLFSIVYATGKGYEIVTSLLLGVFGAQFIVCFIEILVYVWAYGRDRFCRDIGFMTGKPLAKWKFYIIKFVTPTLTVLLTPLLMIFPHPSPDFTYSVAYIMKFFPLVLIPAYAIYKLCKSSGTFRERFRENVNPAEWYPMDENYKQEYLAKFGGASDNTQLKDVSISP